MARRVEHLYDGGAFPLVHVVAGAVPPDGSAVILDRNGSPFVRVIGPDGSERASWGMRGDGPSELRVPEGLSVLGDTALAVWDVGARRLTTFDLDGEVLRTDSHPHVDQWGYRFVGARTDGSWIEQAALSTSELEGTPDGTRYDSVSFYVHPRGGSGRRLLLRVAGPRRQFLTHETGIYSNMRPIFARDVVASMVGDTLLVSTTDSATFQVVVPSGAPGRRHYALSPGRPAGGSEIAEEVQRRIEEQRAIVTNAAESLGPFADGKRRMAEAEMDMIRHLSAHSSIPLFATVMSGNDGAAWFREYGASADRNVYWSCPPDRAEGLSLQLRADERLLAIGFGTVVSVRTDPFDVETVVIAAVGGRR